MIVFKKFIYLFVILTSLSSYAQVDEIKNKINLAELIVDGSLNDEANQLIQEVIKKQKLNSPKSLNEYQFKSYAKFILKNQYNDIPDYPLASKKDSQNYNNYKESLRHHQGLLEKGTTYAFKKGKGEKVITEAVRISGIQTPLLEIAAVDPLPYEFNQDEFQFFYFRSFINPLSNKGLQHYTYQIQDTILFNGRKTIEVSFKNLNKDEKPLYGSLLIDLEDKALAEFNAEYEGDYSNNKKAGIQFSDNDKSKKNYYLTSKFKKFNDAWFPLSQEYYRVENAYYHKDSTQKPPKKYTYTKTISAKINYFDHHKTASLNAKDFKGFNQEISKAAFTKFNEVIPTYRAEPLTQQEKQTYVVIDSLGKEENINEMIKYGRFFLNGFNIPLGKVDFYLPSIFSYNAYEGVQLGAQINTNRNFHPNIGLQAMLKYGFKDEDFKYMLGANYLINKDKYSLIGIKYKDDVKAFARPVSELRRNLNYIRESFINSNNENYFDYKQLQVYLNTTFFENLDFHSSLSLNQEKALIDYAYKDFLVDTKFKQMGFNFNLRYSPNVSYITMPYGKITTHSSSPHFYVTGYYSTPYKDEGYKSLQLQASAEHAFSWFNKTAHLLLRGGKVFGDAPLWRNFNQGLRGDGSWFKPWSLGSSNNFETMPAMKFYSEYYVMAQWRQEWFTIYKDVPIFSVIKAIYGDFEHKELHHGLAFDTLDKGYFEGGIEVRKILLNALGFGAYYRFGEYNTSKFKEDFALKLTLDLPFGKIRF